MSIRTIALLAGIVSAGAWVVAQETLPLAGGPAGAADAQVPTDARHHSYAIGIDIGASFRRDGLEMDVDSLIAGLRDGLAGAERKYSEELCGLALERLSQHRLDTLRKRNAEFLIQNAKAQGVVSLPSGLQYKVLQAGPGRGQSPTLADTVRVNYVGKLVDGTIFDQSGGEPAELEVGRVIDGWTEALQKMKMGDKWELAIPSALAYGENGAGDVIPPHATLIFEIELVGVVGR